MKIKLLLSLVILLGLQSRAIGSTNVTLVSIGTNSSTFNVSTGQVCKIVYEQKLGTAGALEVNITGGTFFPTATQGSTPLPVYVGPVTIVLDSGAATSSHVATLELSTPADSFIPINSVVIPADSTGPVNIILESSPDLVSWYSSLPGTYGANYTNRFFRVRAQLAP